ncbi:MAG: leucine-rich repeat protein [Treponema sp.]|nr:leucine-rich repeat protein [Treponema sp.]
MKSFKSILTRLISVFVMLFVVISCSNMSSPSSDDSPATSADKSEEVKQRDTVSVTSITVTKEVSDAILTEDGTLKLVAKVLPENATNKKVTWISSNQTIATVNSSGLVTAHQLGSVIIQAVSDENAEKYGSITLEVIENNYNATGELEYELSSDGTYYILKGIGTYDGYVINIPAEHNSLPIKEIGAMAFYRNKNIKSVTIPESIEKIGYSAFANCESLAKIKYNAVNCADFTNSSAPFNSSSSSSVNRTCIIGNKVEKLPAYLFYSSPSNIEAIIFEENSSVKTISSYIVYNDKIISEIVIPESVETIENYAFYGLPAVESIKCYSDTVSLKEYWFNNKYQTYSSVNTIEEKPIAYYTGSNCHTIPQYFANGIKIKSFEYEGSITKICNKAFKGSEFLCVYNLPSSVEEIGDNVFYNAKFSDATVISIPESTKLIGEYAFEGVSNMAETLVLSGVETLKQGAFYNTNIKSIDFGDKITSIPSGVVVRTPVETIRIGTAVTKIYYDAFNSCPNIKKFMLYGNVEDGDDNPYGSKPSSKHPLFYCDETEYSKDINVIIGNSVKKIPAYLFIRNSEVEGRIGSIIFEDSGTGENTLLTIGASAFYGQNNLINLVIPSKVELVQALSFGKCDNLNNVEVYAKEVKDAFYESSIINLKIGKEVESISLDRLKSLTHLYYNAKDAKCSGELLGDEGNKFLLTIGNEVEKIQSKFLYGKKVYVSKVEFEQNSKLKNIESWFLAGDDTSISELILPESLESAALGSLKGLNYLYVGPNIKTISASVKTTINDKAPFIDFNAEKMNDNSSSIANAVLTCSSSAKIRIGKNVMYIPEEFLYKSEADIVYFEQEAVCSEIGREAFREAKINILEIPTSITKVGDDTFNFSDIKNIYSEGSSYSALSGITNWTAFFNDEIESAKKYYYSATEKNNCWHYGEDEVPVLW